jgi:beta-lactamase class A
MRPLHALVLAAALSLAPVPLRSQPADLARQIDARIAQLRAAAPDAVVGIEFRDLARTGAGARLTVNADTVFHAASTMKLPVLIELFRQADAGALALDQPLLLVNQFGSIVDGSPYTLDAGDDSDSSLYRRVGERVPIRELARRMITRSSNLATNALIPVVDAKRADATARRLGATRTRVLRGVEDGPAFRQGLNNVTTAADLAAMLVALEEGRAASASATAEMRDILLAQEFNSEIPAGLPRGTRVAHKTGSITGVLHDAAIVYPDRRRPYVLVVLTRGVPQPALARQLIVDVARLVHAAAMQNE